MPIIQAETLFQRNLAFLERFDPRSAALVRGPGKGLCRIQKAANGQPSLLLRRGENEYWLHSRFDPGKEARSIAGKLDHQSDHILVSGLGLGYHLLEIMDKKKRGARVLLLEPEVDIFRCFLQLADWRFLVEECNLLYLVGPDRQALPNIVTGFIDLPAFKGLAHVELASETRLLKEAFETMQAWVEDEIKILLMDFVTMIAEDAAVPRNILRNLGAMFSSRTVASLHSLYRGTPGIIASAGPSLDRNALQLKSIRERALIISVDTALKPLLAYGIQPHFTVAADPSFRNYLHLRGTSDRLRHFVVAESGVHPQVFKDFIGRTIVASLGKPLMRLLEERSGFCAGEMAAWGSVISLAVQFAAHLGLDPIVFIGQDFAYSDNRNHCRHTSWEQEWLAGDKRLDEMQRREKNSITGNSRLIQALDVNGDPVFTSERLLLYKKYLLNQLQAMPGHRFINASEGGVLTEITHIPLRRVIRDYIWPASPPDLDLLKTEPLRNTAGYRARAREFCLEKEEFFSDFLQELQKLLPLLKACRDSAETGLVELLEKSEKLANRLYEIPENGEMVEFWSRAPVFRFLKEGRAASSPEMLRLAYLNYFQDLGGILDDMVKRFRQSAGALLEID